MEKLILTCGRFVPAEGSSEVRIKALEDHLSRLVEELELIISEVGRTLDTLNAEREEG